VLDFLVVLGFIPGTNFQITFNELVIVTLVVLVWAYRRKLWQLAITQKHCLVAYLKQRYWQHRQLSLPV